MKLIAITAVKYGKPDPEKGIPGATAEPGETFEVDDKMGKALIDAGAAAKPEHYARAKAASRPDSERIAELEAERAELETANETLTSQVATLTADLEKAKADLEDAKKKAK